MKNVVRMIVTTLLLTACAKESIETTSTNNPEFKVEKLFIVDDCNVYRFYDFGNPRYLVTCPSVANVRWFEICGKNCVRETGVDVIRK